MLILEVLKGDEEDITKFLSNKSEQINWKKFLDLTIHHRVYPLMFLKLQKLKEGIVPKYVEQTIEGLYRRNVFKMLQLSSEMEHLANIFHTNNIKTIFLKGPMLGSEIYGDVSMRTCGDLDLLISIEDINFIHTLLESHGYLKDDYIKTVLEDWKWRHHHITYHHKTKKIKIEIHWRLNPGPGKEPDFYELWKRKREMFFSGNPIYILGREDLFLFLVSHGARHGWSRIRWLSDIHQMVTQELNWRKINSLIKKYDNSHLVGQAVILVSELLNSKITDGMKNFHRDKRSISLSQEAIFYLKDMVNLHDEPVDEKIFLYHKRYLYSLMSVQQKILHLFSYLYPYHIDSVTLPLPKKLHFLYFILRPFLCIWRKAKRQAFS
ncbi:nucleotidyltransferase family protein [Bacillus sp. ISL-41]|uniref:nucleotidyltransferase domain-containing protein n=1 Tax=Bacillus sp. ISL-41 TaxID=2819127 RepID=UPI001BE8D14F|nr:nucleotidyltransferase family protein [Bacillus sp. ISL-41]MBT2642184.1 nucleotidyltransferase family protein [Bacillus sp. ISL-41]